MTGSFAPSPMVGTDVARLAQQQPTSAVDSLSSSGSSSSERQSSYKGFVAGLASGCAKLTVGHPFDTVKVRLQTTDSARFRGPLACLVETVRKEGVRALYKGATPPLAGWMLGDALMLGSLTLYRRLLHETIFAPKRRDGDDDADGSLSNHRLPALGHAIAGVMAGFTVTFLATPVEHVKVRLQVQYKAKAQSLYRGPIDCVRQIYRHHGVQGIYHGFCANLVFRSFFFFWWGSYDVISRALAAHRPHLSPTALNFWAGGLSAQVFWLTAYPSDVVKQRRMADALGGGLGDGTPRVPRWIDAARAVHRDAGWRGFWRGFAPCFLRAFPANAAALACFEAAMRTLP